MFSSQPFLRLCAGEKEKSVRAGRSAPAILTAALDFIDGMGQAGEDGSEVFPGSSFTTWQIYDQAIFADSGHSAGKDGVGCLLEACHTHHLADAGDLFVKKGKGGFRGLITGAYSGAACGKDQVKALLVTPVCQGGGNVGRVVGYNGVFADGVGAGVAQLFLELRAAGVLPLTTGTFIADGENAAAVYF